MIDQTNTKLENFPKQNIETLQFEGKKKHPERYI